MRAAFHEQLDSLSEMLSNMCGFAGLAMDRATQALLRADLAMAEQVFTDHDELAYMQTSAEEARAPAGNCTEPSVIKGVAQLCAPASGRHGAIN
jgi:hypothetical protein